MSRSYKHNPVLKINRKFYKRYANKVVRHKIIYNYSFYKKLFGRWDIYDYSIYYEWYRYRRQYISDIKLGRRYDNNNRYYYQEYNHYCKWYRRK